jgi:hypothetical protein
VTVTAVTVPVSLGVAACGGENKPGALRVKLGMTPAAVRATAGAPLRSHPLNGHKRCWWYEIPPRPDTSVRGLVICFERRMVAAIYSGHPGDEHPSFGPR